MFKRQKKAIEGVISDPKKFFEKHSINANMKPVPLGISVPEPILDDLEWAKDFYKKDSSIHNDFLDIFANQPHLWRLQFMLSAQPDKPHALQGGLDPWNKDLLIQMMSDKSRDRMMLALSCIEPSVPVLQKVIETCPMDTFIAVTNKYKDQLSQSDRHNQANHETICTVIETGSSEKIAHLYDAGYNFYTRSQEKIQHAHTHHQPAIAQQMAALCTSAHPETATDTDTDTDRITPTETWVLLTSDQIARNTVMNNGQKTTSEIFNFTSRKITTIHNDYIKDKTTAVVSNFDDSRYQKAIIKATEEYTKCGGTTPEIKVSKQHKLSLATLKT